MPSLNPATTKEHPLLEGFLAKPSDYRCWDGNPATVENDGCDLVVFVVLGLLQEKGGEKQDEPPLSREREPPTRQYIHSWNLFVLYFGVWTLQKKALPFKTRGPIWAPGWYVILLSGICPVKGSNYSCYQAMLPSETIHWRVWAYDVSWRFHLLSSQASTGICSWLVNKRNADASFSPFL